MLRILCLKTLGSHPKVFQCTNLILIHSFRSIIYAQETLMETDIKKHQNQEIRQTEHLEQTNQ